MTCARNVEPDAAERYVLGQMTEPELSAFEEHYFACDDCFQTVQALQDLQVVLRTSPSAHVKKDETRDVVVPIAGRTPKSRTAVDTRIIVWGLAAAASVLMAVVLWQRQQPASPEPSTTIAKSEPATPGGPTTPRGSGAAGGGTGATTSTPSTTPSPSTTPDTTAPPKSDAPPVRRPLDLTALAMIVPPPYVPLNTRGADSSAQTQAFQTAMASYSAKDYRAAATGLRALADANPSDARTQFFLGVSLLMTGEESAAIAALDQAVASGAAPFASEAHFYLAKAALRQKDLTRAERELNIAVEQEAGPAGEAQRMLRQLRASRQN